VGQTLAERPRRTQEEFAEEPVPGFGGAAEFGANALEYPTGDAFAVPAATDDGWGADAGAGVGAGFEVAAAPEQVYAAPAPADFAAGY